MFPWSSFTGIVLQLNPLRSPPAFCKTLATGMFDGAGFLMNASS